MMPALLAAKSKVLRGTPFGPMTITVPPSFLTSLPVVTAAAMVACRWAGSVRLTPV